MALLTQWTWVWISSRGWWKTGKPGILQSMGSQRVGTNQVTKHFTEYSTVTGYKINTQKYLAFLYTNNEVSEREVLMNLFPLSSVQSLSPVWFFATPWTAACQASLSITNSRSLFKLMSIKSLMPSNHHCHPRLLPPSIFPIIRVFSNESALCIQRTKYWRFSFRTSPYNKFSGLISLRIDWLDLLALQGTLKSLL